MKLEYVMPARHERGFPNIYGITKPLHEDEAAHLLLGNTGCHVDHEGFDLNEIEQVYYKANGISLTKDPTWYKDGNGVTGANAIIFPWFTQTSTSNLIIDHSHFVVRFPMLDAAADQIRQFAKYRPELYRLLSVNYKCGLDLCIDYLNPLRKKVEPIVHIEWDFDKQSLLNTAADQVENYIEAVDWSQIVPVLVRYNELARGWQEDAFVQANTRAQILFGKNAYKLIPTI